MRLTRLIEDRPVRFRTQADVDQEMRFACLANPEVAAFHELGKSEEGRHLNGVVLGTGSRSVTLVAGAHADEPVGPETLRTLVLGVLREPDRFQELLNAYRLFVVSHVNPDGESRNAPWIRRWPDPRAYVAGAVRELPGRDIEFGYPAMRPENQAVSAFLSGAAPVSLHMSLHGMGFAEGAMLLIERRWGYRTAALRSGFAKAARLEGLGLHDHNRRGEKGFFYLDPGFSTTPEGAAMRTYFRSLGDSDLAACFHDSSMEFVSSLGGEPLSLVTEIPLFHMDSADSPSPGLPERYLSFREELAVYAGGIGAGTGTAGPSSAELSTGDTRGVEKAERSNRSELAEASHGDSAWERLAKKYNVQPVKLRSMVRLQLRALELGLEAVSG